MEAYFDGKANSFIKQINELILKRDRDNLYLLCQNSLLKVLAEENSLLHVALVMSDVDRQESTYRGEDTVFSMIDADGLYSPLEQLSAIYDDTSRYLFRFSNNLPEEWLIEGIEYFIQHRISGDLLAAVCIDKMEDYERVLDVLAKLYKEEDASVTLRIYKTLQEEVKKPKYYIAAAEIYMELGDLSTAYDVLNRVKDKTEEIDSMLNMLRSKGIGE